jgi:hypothetical protein
MVEQVSLSEGPPNQPEFTNDDGTPATWVEPLTKTARGLAFALRFGISLVIALGIWALQHSNGVLRDMYPVGLVMLIVGAGIGINAYRKTTVRRFSFNGVPVPHGTRLFRAFLWVFWSAAITLFFSLVVSPQDASFTLWWYTGCAAIVVIPGIMFYTWKRETPLTPKAAAAKIYYARFAGPPTNSLMWKADTAIDKLFAKPPVRYAAAAAFLWGAYHFAFESTVKDSGWVAVACVVVAGVFAREVSRWVLGAGLWVLGLGLVALIGWALFAGVAALPVSVAVIIGAIIIAGAVSR